MVNRVCSCSTRSLDFGELMINSQTGSVTKKFSLVNEWENSVKLNLSIGGLSESLPVTAAVALDDDHDCAIIEYKDEGFGISHASGLNYVHIRPASSCVICVTLTLRQFSSTEDIRDYVTRTTFDKESFSLNFDLDSESNYIIDGDEMLDSNSSSDDSLGVLICASFCLSLMSVDDYKIEFDQSIVGGTYVRDFQVWNRSECPLVYRLVAQNRQQGQVVQEIPYIKFQDFDNSTSISLQDPIQIPAFGSKRIRTIFRATNIGDDEFTVEIQNMNNNLNNLSLFIHTSVVEQDNETSVLTLERVDEDDNFLDKNTVDFGCCFYNVMQVKQFYIKNSGKFAVSACLECTTAQSEVVFKVAGNGLTDSKAAISIQNMVHQSDSCVEDAVKFAREALDEKKLCKGKHSRRDSVSDYQDLDGEEEEGENGGGEDRLQREKRIELANFDAENSRLRERCYELSASHNRLYMPAVISYLYNNVVVDTFEDSIFSTRSYSVDDVGPVMFAGYAPSSGKEHAPGKPSKSIKYAPSGVVQEDSISSRNVEKTVQSYEKFVLPPGGRTLVSIMWRPCRRVTQNKSSVEDTAEAFEDTRLRISLKHRDLDNFMIPTVDEFTTVGRWISSSIVCECRCCDSIITTSAPVNGFDLGECSIGDVRTEKVSFRNRSPLSVRICPTVLSDSLTLLCDKEVVLAPHESKQFTFEYIARNVNTNYCNTIFLYNASFPQGSVQFQLRAKNVDTHQIVLHSLFYKIFTGNPRKFAQISFDHCVYNFTNIKIFSIRNVFKEPLVLHLGAPQKKTNDVRLYHIKYDGDVLKKPLDNNLLLRYFSSLYPIHDPDAESGMNSSALSAGGNSGANNVQTPASAAAKNFHMEDMKWGSAKSFAVGSMGARPRNSSTDDLESLKKSSKSALHEYGNLDLAVHVEHSGGSDSVADGLDIENKRMSLVQRRMSDAVVPEFERRVSKSDEVTSNADYTNVNLDVGPKSIEFVPQDPKQFDVLSVVDSPEFPFNMWEKVKSSIEAALAGAHDDGVVAPESSSKEADAEGTHKTGNAIRNLIAGSTLLNDVRDAKDEDLARVRMLERIVSDAKQFMESDKFMCELDLQNESSEFVTIPVNRTFHFAVTMNPISTGSEASLSSNFAVDDVVASSISGVAQTDRPINVSIPDVDSSHILSRNLELKLLSVNMRTVNALLKKMNTDASDANNSRLLHVENISECSAEEPLKIRSVEIRARATRSDMSLSVKSVNFGKTLVGIPLTRDIIITNNSSIPLIYSISKSGSISSGFLRITSGRKGQVAPLASKTIEFVFKPALNGVFEEILKVQNVLDKTNTATVVIKAKVAKPEYFQLLPLEDTGSMSNSASGSLPGDSNDPSKSNSLVAREGGADANLYDAAVVDEEKNRVIARMRQHMPVGNVSSSAHLDSVSGNNISGSGENLKMGLSSTYIGEGVVGRQFSTVVGFRIRNVTSKPRKFVVDASHLGAISLVDVPPPPSVSLCESISPTWTIGSPKKSIDIEEPVAVADMNYSTVNDMSPDCLLNACSLLCDFEEESVPSNVSKASVMSAVERSSLEDILEFYQQKLKIAVRKGKEDKIAKYTIKLRDTMKLLNGELPLDSKLVFKEDKGSDDEKEKGGEPKTGKDIRVSKDIVIAPMSVPEGQPISRSCGEIGSGSNLTAEKPNPITVRAAANVFSINIPADHDSVVKVRITVLPGPRFKYWKGILPVAGYFRIYESKNEDLVKQQHFNMILACAPPVELDKGKSNDGISGAIMSRGTSVSSCVVQAASSNVSAASQCSSFALVENLDPSVPEQVKVGVSLPDIVSSVFIAAPAPWSSLSTRELYGGRWDNNASGGGSNKFEVPESICNMSLKLVRAEGERRMQGSITITSKIQEDLCISISVCGDAMDKLNHLNQSFTLAERQYQLFDSKIHGVIGFAVASDRLDAEVPRYSDSVCLDLPGRSSRELLVEWVLSDDWHAQQRMLMGYLSLQTLTWNHKPITSSNDAEISQYIPVVCSWEHISIMKVDKKISLGDVALGQQCNLTATITNVSEIESLSYRALVVSTVRNPSCQLEIVANQVGSIEPGAAMEIPLVFSSAMVGKNEQQLLVSNTNDRFDQKKVLIVANVIVNNVRYVQFPDLIADDAGKMKLLDLGLIHVSAFDSSIPPGGTNNAPLKKFVYPFRVVNVCGKDLLFTAISNLKKQCVVYTDKECTSEAIYCPLPKFSIITIYIGMRPTVGDGGSGKSKEDKSQQQRALLSFTRELSGGIRFVFYLAVPKKVAGGDSSLDTFVLSDALREPEKFFEKSITFRGTVGCSYLKVKVLDSLVKFYMRPLVDACAINPDTYGMFVGRICLSNPSNVFPIEYKVESDGNMPCIPFIFGRLDAELPNSIAQNCDCWDRLLEEISCRTEKEGGLTPFTIWLGDDTGFIEQNAISIVHYLSIVPVTAQGLLSESFSISNTNTGDNDAYTIRHFFDRSCLKVVNDDLYPLIEWSPKKPNEYPSAGATSSFGPVAHSEVDSKNAVTNGLLNMMGGNCSDVKFLPMNQEPCGIGLSSPLWIISKVLDESPSSQPSLAMPSIIVEPPPPGGVGNVRVGAETSSFESISASAATASVPKLPPISSMIFQCSGVVSAHKPLFEWRVYLGVEFHYSSSKTHREAKFEEPLWVYPITNLPLIISPANQVCPVHPTKSMSYLLNSTRSSRGDMIPCGDAFLLLPQQDDDGAVYVDLTVSCNKGAYLNHSLFNEMKMQKKVLKINYFYNSLNAGKRESLRGHVGFVVLDELAANNLDSVSFDTKSVSPDGELFYKNDWHKSKRGVGGIGGSVISDNTAIGTRYLNQNMIGYYFVECNFVQPAVKLLCNSSFKFEKVRPGQSVSFEIVVENMCDAEVSFVINDVPAWLTVRALKVQNSPMPLVNSNGAFDNILMSPLPSHPSTDSDNVCIKPTILFAEDSDIVRGSKEAIASTHNSLKDVYSLSGCSTIHLRAEVNANPGDTVLDAVIKIQGLENKKCDCELMNPLPIKIHVEVDDTKPLHVMQTGGECRFMNSRQFCTLKHFVTVPYRAVENDFITSATPSVAGIAQKSVKDGFASASIRLKNQWEDCMRVSAGLETHSSLKSSIELKLLFLGGFFPARSLDLTPDESTEFKIICKGTINGRLNKNKLVFYDLKKQQIVSGANITSHSGDNVNDDDSLTAAEAAAVGRDPLSSKGKQNKSLPKSLINSDGSIGPVLLGTMKLKSTVVKLSSTGQWPDAPYDLDQDLSGTMFDNVEEGVESNVVSVDIVGFITPAPTAVVAPVDHSDSNEDSINGLVFYANSMNEAKSNSISSRIPKPSSFQQLFSVKEQYQNVRIVNDSKIHSMHYEVTSKSSRRVGMKLVLSANSGTANCHMPAPDFRDSPYCGIFSHGLEGKTSIDAEGDMVMHDEVVWSDTVSTASEPSNGDVDPGNAAIISLYMGTGKVTDALSVNQQFFSPDNQMYIQLIENIEIPSRLHVLAVMTLLISDKLYPLHPPCRIPVILISNVELPFVDVKLLNKNTMHSRNQGHLPIGLSKQRLSAKSDVAASDSEEAAKVKLQSDSEELSGKGEKIPKKRRPKKTIKHEKHEGTTSDSEEISNFVQKEPFDKMFTRSKRSTFENMIEKNSVNRGPGRYLHRKLGSMYEDFQSNIPVELEYILGDFVPDRPVLRLRGVSPCSSGNDSRTSNIWAFQAAAPVQYEINVGQHSLNGACLEWELSLENDSSLLPLKYRISTMDATGDSGYDWVLVNQSGGVVQESGTNAVILYFQRVQVGYFFTYIMVENLSNAGDVRILRVSMEVVQNWARSSNKLVGLLKPLFHVFTSVWQREDGVKQLLGCNRTTRTLLLSDAPAGGKKGKKESLLLDYRNVCHGKHYRRRSIVLVNATDVILDMKLSSSFLPSEVSFVLSVHTNKPTTTVSLGPHERKDVFVFFAPTVECSQSVANKTEGDEEADGIDRHYNEVSGERCCSQSCLIEGEIYISCRLMKDRHETVKVIARCHLEKLNIKFQSVQSLLGASDENLLNVPPTYDNLDVLKCGPLWLLSSATAPYFNYVSDILFAEGLYLPRGLVGAAKTLGKENNCTFCVQIGADHEILIDDLLSGAPISSAGYDRGISSGAVDCPASVEQNSKASSNSPSSISLKWIASQFICVRNKDENESVSIAICGFMQRFGMCLVSKSSDLMNVCMPEMSSIALGPLESVILFVFPVFKPDNEDGDSEVGESRESTGDILSDKDRHKKLASRDDVMVIAEEYFTVYSRCQSAEKYRIPVRLMGINSEAVQEVIGGTISDGSPLASQNSNSAGMPLSGKPTQSGTKAQYKFCNLGSHNSSSTATLSVFADLESAVAAYVRDYTAFWKMLIDVVAENKAVEYQLTCLRHGMRCATNDSFPEPPQWHQLSVNDKVRVACEILQQWGADTFSIQHDFLCSQSRTAPRRESVSNDTFDNMLQSVEMDTSHKIALLEERLRCHHGIFGAAAASFVELFFNFFVIADHLSLITIQQTVQGYRAVSSHSGQPAARLSQLFFSVIFLHYSFSTFLGRTDSAIAAAKRAARMGDVVLDIDKSLEKVSMSSTMNVHVNLSRDASPNNSPGKGGAVPTLLQNLEVSDEVKPDIEEIERYFTLPSVLVPYCRMFLYFMNFFPELGDSAESLVNISNDIKKNMPQ